MTLPRTWADAWNAIVGKHWRSPRKPSAEVPQSEREGRRVTPVEGSGFQ